MNITDKSAASYNRTDKSVIVLDAEFTDTQEILELTIASLNGQIIYHQYFKPVESERWPNSQRIHHITPAMVADKPTFKSCRNEIQKIIDSSDYICGFAVDNDLRHLNEHGIDIDDDKRVIEVRRWYWLLRGKDNGLDFGITPGLSAVLTDMEIAFDDSEAHSATADTLNTLKLFVSLSDSYRHLRGFESLGLDGLITEFDKEYAEYERLHAAGAAYIIMRNGVCQLKMLANRRDNLRDAVAEIEVADRARAEYEIRRQFQRRQSNGSTYLYSLRKSDLDWFSNYTNTYDPEDHAYYKALLKGKDKLFGI